MTFDKLPAIHPGEILSEEYISPTDMSAGALSKELYVCARALNASPLKKRV